MSIVELNCFRGCWSGESWRTQPYKIKVKTKELECSRLLFLQISNPILFIRIFQSTELT